MNTSSRPPRWHRAGSVIGILALMAALAVYIYRWVDALSRHATGTPVHETAMSVYDSLQQTAIHTSDAVGVSDLVIFAASLILARILYTAIDTEQWSRDKKRLRRAAQRVTRVRELLTLPPLNDERDLELSQQHLVAHTRNRPSGI